MRSLIILTILAVSFQCATAKSVRLKDLVSVKGVRKIQLLDMDLLSVLMAQVMVAEK